MIVSPVPRAGVLCAGTLLVDFGKVIDAYPSIDGLATIEQLSKSTGGSALNLAVDLCRLGATFPVALLGTVADDENGAYILDACATAGIDVSRVRTEPGAVTASTDVMVERVGGRRTFFTYMGTNALLRVSAHDLETSQARVLHVGNLGVHPHMDDRTADGGNGWSALLEAAQSSGMWTNMELASFEAALLVELAGPCLPHLDSIVINELEAGALTGVDAPAPDAAGQVDWPAMEAMALGLIERGVSALAVVHFPAGSVAANAHGRVWRQGSVRVALADVRSTNGAGDAFAAGVVLGVHEGWPVEACLRLGAATAAACIRSTRTSDGIGAAADCLTGADRLGYRPTDGPG